MATDNSKNLLVYKKALMKRREALIHRVAAQKEQEKDTSEMGHGDDLDQASARRDRELSFLISSKERVELKAIDQALQRINDGTYGICAQCGKVIASKRLKALPFTLHCLNCQVLMEIRSSEEKRNLGVDLTREF